MRNSLIGTSSIAMSAGALGLIAACAASAAEEESMLAPVDGGSVVLGDATVPTASDATDEGFGEPPRCSEAGWCKTELPGEDLVLKDVWPVGEHAFAIAESQSLGNKFLEWDKTNGWKFIDWKIEFTNFVIARTGWAPDEDEVFYSLDDLSALAGVGLSGIIVLHGTRPSPPETRWSWTRTKIDCSDVMPGLSAVRGTGRDEVYALSCGKVHRLNRTGTGSDAGIDGGSGTAGETWEVDYADADGIDLRDATGAGPGDIWFNAARVAGGVECAVLLRKTAAGYRTVVDSVPTSGVGCVARPGIPMIDGVLDQPQALDNERLVAVQGISTIDNGLVHIALAGNDVEITMASPATTMDVILSAPWGTSADDLWVLSKRDISSGGSILRATSIWQDGGSFVFSTLALNGAPNTKSLERLRGTSNTNLWVVGRDRAYFKSTP